MSLEMDMDEAPSLPNDDTAFDFFNKPEFFLNEARNRFYILQHDKALENMTPDQFFTNTRLVQEAKGRDAALHHLSAWICASDHQAKVTKAYDDWVLDAHSTTRQHHPPRLVSVGF